MSTTVDWMPDELLGDAFATHTLSLHDDDEGPVVATLIRHTPVAEPRAVMLAIHGWNDYFYQYEFAQEMSRRHIQFYAIDLRKYGRSHLEHQTWGYAADLSIYDEDIHAALDIISTVHTETVPIVFYGHSTGGLTAALWAHRHPYVLSGLVLNSPWLELQGSTLLRQIGQPMIDAMASFAPDTILPLKDTGFYQRTLTAWHEDGATTVEPSSDPFISGGWKPDERYRHVPSFPIRAGWVAAILRGHAQVAEGLDITCPVLVLTSARSHFASTWSEQMRQTDTVLEVSQIWKRVPALGAITTLIKLDGAIHDVILSRSEVRESAYRHIDRWLQAFVNRD